MASVSLIQVNFTDVATMLSVGARLVIIDPKSVNIRPYILLRGNTLVFWVELVAYTKFQCDCISESCLPIISSFRDRSLPDLHLKLFWLEQMST